MSVCESHVRWVRLKLLVHDASTFISYLNGCLVVLIGALIAEVTNAEGLS